MAGLKEIKRRLRSVKNTKKITYAMKLVSAAKLRKAQDAVTSSRAYTDGLNRLLAALRAEQEDGGEFNHPLMATHEQVRKVRVVAVGGNRGLCGGYNSNLNRRLMEFVRSQKQARPEVEYDFVALGKKPAQFFRRVKLPYLKAYEALPEDGVRWPIEEFVTDLVRDFEEGSVDEVHLIYTEFRSALSVKPKVVQLLPLALPQEDAGHQGHDHIAPGMTIFEPSVKEVFQAVVPRIVRSRLLQAVLDAKASEHGSRMTAMDSATKNAGDLIDKLQLKSNKLRQTGVTSDLLDIVGGAEALSGK